MSRAHHLSMSKMSLAHLCAWSFRADSPQHPRPVGAPARIGSGVHACMEHYVKHGKVLSDLPKMAPEEAAEALAFFSPPVQAFLDSIPWSACEIGLRYDAQADDAELGPRRGEKGYAELGAMVVPGTLDLVANEPDIVTVVDLKSGKKQADREQLYTQAVAAARFYKKPAARVAYVYARKTKCDPPDWEYLDADALDMHAGRISRLLRKLPMAEPVADAEAYCWRCDSRPSCPAFGAEAAEAKMQDMEKAGLFA